MQQWRGPRTSGVARGSLRPSERHTNGRDDTMTSRQSSLLARWMTRLTLLATGTLLGAGCGGSGGTKTGADAGACTTGGTGQLTIAVTGLPAGVTPMVR